MIREQLKLENQLCFPVYAASRLITRIYQPYLDEIGITYPQYLVLLVLWEKDEITVNEISRKLFLNTNTTTPLLKRLESQGLITRRRSGEDERKVIIALTAKGKKLQSKASGIPGKLSEGLAAGSLGVSELIDLKGKLYKIIDFLTERPG
jgi:MarR family transcriptional regulator, organic hydroperoxide resistance regulator